MTEYKYTYWNRNDWFHSDCWANAEKTAERFPQCVAKAEELGKELIEARIKWEKWNAKHPGKFKAYPTTDIPAYRWEKGNKEDCIEYFLAYEMFNAWFEKTEAYKRAMDGTQRQIWSYFKHLADNPDRVTDALDADHRPYQYKRIAERIEEAKKLNRR